MENGNFLLDIHVSRFDMNESKGFIFSFWIFQWSQYNSVRVPEQIIDIGLFDCRPHNRSTIQNKFGHKRNDFRRFLRHVNRNGWRRCSYFTFEIVWQNDEGNSCGPKQLHLRQRRCIQYVWIGKPTAFTASFQLIHVTHFLLIRKN